MAASHRQIGHVAQKLENLDKERKALIGVLDTYVDQILALGKSWVDSQGSLNYSYRDISAKIETALTFILEKFEEVPAGLVTEKTAETPTALSSAPTGASNTVSTDQQIAQIFNRLDNMENDHLNIKDLDERLSQVEREKREVDRKKVREVEGRLDRLEESVKDLPTFAEKLQLVEGRMQLIPGLDEAVVKIQEEREQDKKVIGDIKAEVLLIATELDLHLLSNLQTASGIIKNASPQGVEVPVLQSDKPLKLCQKKLTTGQPAIKKWYLEEEVLSIMDRLSPTNFERKVTEMWKLNIKTYGDLQELVNVFWDKVTIETKCMESYANLCKYMCGLKVPPPPNSGIKENQATFRVVILTKCQQEFEADKSIIFKDPEEQKKKIESENPEGPERDELIEKTLYWMKMRRLKFYGNIRFLGELFKLGMLRESVMHDCILRLLKAGDDASIVSVCSLITTAGQKLDTEKAKKRMDQYFDRMATIVEDWCKPAIKFALQDVIDLRNNGWIPLKKQTDVKEFFD